MDESVRKVALVTGASRGIGKAIAIQLAKDGYDIAFCYKNNSAAAEDVKSDIDRLGRHVYMEACNTTDFQSVKEFIQKAEETLGLLSVVVNNAGITRDNPLLKMDEDSWKEVLNTNLDSVFNVCKSCIFNFMKQKKGCIVNISSVSGVYGNATQVNYSASKAGMIGFSKALAKEVGSYGIRVNVVAPGFIETDMTGQLDDKLTQRVIANIPLRRMGNVHEVSNLVSFLVSDRASYITGQVIQVDGGIIL
jgi:3-oxoacyl-[acyl-carrier protein] reductase